MGYAFEGWKVTYTRRYDTDYGEYGTVTNVTIGDTNIPIGYHGIFSDGKGNENSLATESIARLIAAAPKLYEAIQAVDMALTGQKTSLEEWANTSRIVRAALAKVRGEDKCHEQP